MVLTSPEYSLDRSARVFGDETRRRAPHGLMQEYLNAAPHVVWGLVSNGLVLRLLRDNPSLTRPAYVEADLNLIFEDQLYADFVALWLIFHATRLKPGSRWTHVLYSRILASGEPRARGASAFQSASWSRRSTRVNLAVAF